MTVKSGGSVFEQLLVSVGLIALILKVLLEQYVNKLKPVCLDLILMFTLL